jgi:hemolysin activation/secretion protein
MACALCVSQPSLVFAQVESRGLESGGVRKPVYTEPQLQEPAPQIKEPALPGGEELPEVRSSLTPAAGISVVRIEIEGNTILSNEELGALTTPYEDRVITPEELQQLRHDLSNLYVSRGYANSGVIIPDQQVEDGIITLQVIEGRLTEINIEGNRHLTNSYLSKRIGNDLDGPLNVNQLRENLLLLQRDPMVDQINAELMPGTGPGQDYLNVNIAESPRWFFTAVADNYRPPSIGENQGSLYMNLRSLIASGDLLSGKAAFTEGSDDYALSYVLPVNSSGMTLEGFITNGDYKVVEDPFDVLDIESQLKSWGLALAQPIITDLNRSLRMVYAFENKRNENSLLGMPFSLAPGDVNGMAEGSSLFLGAEFSLQGAQQVLDVRGTVQVGIDAFGATIDPSGGADSEFVAALGQLQYLRQFLWRQSQLLFRTSFQFTGEPLLAMYKLAIGGRYSVRGYRQNLFIRDNGFAGQLEYQIPVLVNRTRVGASGLKVAAFADYGVSWDKDKNLVTSDSDNIYSVGVGLIWNPIQWLFSEFYWGADLKDRDTRSDSWQDQGFNYQIRFQKGFGFD